MTSFCRVFRCVQDPRYRLMGVGPFRTFPQFRAAFEAQYSALDLSAHRSIPRDQHFGALARDTFFRRFYPELEWPDWLAGFLFLGICVAIQLAAAALSNWGVIAPTVLVVVMSHWLWQERRRQRDWDAEARRFFHIRRQQTTRWQYQ